MAFNPGDKSAEITLSNNNRTATRESSNNNTWRLVRSVTSKSTGKWYFEVKNDANGSGNGYLLFGVCGSGLAITAQIGGSSGSWGLQANNTSNLLAYHAGTTVTVVSGSLASLSAGEVAMLAIDFDSGKGWWGTKGVWRSGNPSAGTGNNFSFTPNISLFIGVNLFGTPQVATLQSILTDMAYAPPDGYAAWDVPPFSISGTIYDRNGDPCKRKVYAVSRPTDTAAPVILAHGLSDAVTGAYELMLSNESEVTRVVVSEDDADPLLNDLVDRIIPQ
jgi:hypothetical protein